MAAYLLTRISIQFGSHRTVLNKILAGFYCFILLLENSFCLRMLTVGRVLIANVGEPVQMECQFSSKDFNLFDNPMQWQKRQFFDDHQINMMGNILEPFVSTKRFQTSFEQIPPLYMLSLNLSSVTLEDNGNYSCVINGPENVLLGVTSHALIVTAPPDEIVFSSTNCSSKPMTEDVARTGDNRRVILFKENQPRSLKCTVFGGYPPPDIEISFLHREISNKSHLNRVSSIHGVDGLQVKYYVTERCIDNFRVTPDDDGKKIKCLTSIQGVSKNVSYARIIVHHGPIVKCDLRSAVLDDRNVVLKCEVKARPKPVSIFWIVDDNNTVVSDDVGTKDSYAVFSAYENGVMEAQLVIRKIQWGNFRSYILVAENSIATTRHDVVLHQRQRHTSRPVYNVVMVSSPVKEHFRRYDRLKNGNSPPGNPQFVITAVLTLLTAMTSTGQL